MTKWIPRVVGTLIGDIRQGSGARTKYGLFFAALARRFPLVDVYDASLRGTDRLFNALSTIHPNPYHWRERFYKNSSAFKLRSQRAADYLKKLHNQADVIIQVNVLFDSCWDGLQLPSVIYTDYTAHLAAQRPAAGGFPFRSLREYQRWFELERSSLARAAHVCTRSRLVADSIVRDYGIPSERVTVVGGGVNFAPLPEPAVHWEKPAPTVLFIGKEFYRKGGDVLLRAFAQVRAAIPQARLLFLTTDPIPAELSLDGVEVVAPTWERDVIAGFYRRADLLVLPSRLETWGDVLLEAMVYGLPCIGVCGQAMEEIIDNERTGLLVAPEDVPGLANALLRLLTDVSLRQQLGKTARQQVEAKYTWDQVVARAAGAIQRAASLGCKAHKSE